MEKDRAQADIGMAIDAEYDREKQEKSKQPRKRFVGRRTAAELAERTGHSTENLENNGAVQGRSYHAHDSCFLIRTT